MSKNIILCSDGTGNKGGQGADTNVFKLYNSVKIHSNFKKKHDFPFHLLSDKDETLCKQFDVIHEKNLYGRKYMGIVRSTFLIDGEGVLQQEWRKVRVPDHAQAVLDALSALNKA